MLRGLVSPDEMVAALVEQSQRSKEQGSPVMAFLIDLEVWVGGFTRVGRDDKCGRFFAGRWTCAPVWVPVQLIPNPSSGALFMIAM